MPRLRVLDALALLLVPIAVALVAFAGEGFVDPDAFYHLRYAHLWADGSLPRGTFPWASASTWATSFADKEFLFHVALVLLERLAGDDVVAGKLAAVLFAALLAGALAWTLRSRGAPRPALVTFFVLTSSALFLQRIVFLRALTPAVALVLLLFAALFARRTLATVLVAFLFPLVYVAFFAPLALALATQLARRLKGEPLDPRPVLAVAAGSALGTVVHPDFPRNLLLAWDQVPRVLAHAWTATSLGREQAVEFQALQAATSLGLSLPFFLALAAGAGLVLVLDPRTPLAHAKAVLAALGLAILGVLLPDMDLDTRTALLWGAPLWLGVALLAARAALRSPAVGTDTAVALAATTAAGVATALSTRFFEYLAPLGGLSLGLVARDLLASPEALARLGDTSRLARLPRALGTAVASVLVLGIVTNVLVPLCAAFANAGGPTRYRAAGQWLAAHARPGEVVFHTRWDSFPPLFYFAPEQRFLVALDPAFLYYADADHRRYDLWDKVRRGHETPGAIGDFGARYLVTDYAGDGYWRLEKELATLASQNRARLECDADGVEVWQVLPR